MPLSQAMSKTSGLESFIFLHFAVLVYFLLQTTKFIATVCICLSFTFFLYDFYYLYTNGIIQTAVHFCADV